MKESVTTEAISDSFPRITRIFAKNIREDSCDSRISVGLSSHHFPPKPGALSN